MSVYKAVERDLAVIRESAPHVADSGLAAMALALAVEMDKPKNSATSKSMCARALQDTLRDLRALTPVRRESDGIDDLKSRRAARLGGASEAASAVDS